MSKFYGLFSLHFACALQVASNIGDTNYDRRRYLSEHYFVFSLVMCAKYWVAYRVFH